MWAEVWTEGIDGRCGVAVEFYSAAVFDREGGGGKKNTVVKRRRGSGKYTNDLPRAWATPWPTRRLAW